MPNRATRDIKALAQNFGPEAIMKLVQLMRRGKAEETRTTAIRELLNRGYGRPPMALHHAGHEGEPLRLTDMTLEELKALATRLAHTINVPDSSGGGDRGD